MNNNSRQHTNHECQFGKRKQSKPNMSYVCQCKNGHVFDYRKRIKFEIGNPHYAPCQGKCPVCETTEFSFIGTGVNIYPIKWNFTG